MLKVMTIVGTRPEIIRLSRVIAQLDAHTEHVLVHTGQSYDYELSEIFFRDLGLRTPEADLSVAVRVLVRGQRVEHCLVGGPGGISRQQRLDLIVTGPQSADRSARGGVGAGDRGAPDLSPTDADVHDHLVGEGLFQLPCSGCHRIAEGGGCGGGGRSGSGPGRR